MRLVARTPVIPITAAASVEPAALGFLARPLRLPTFAGTYHVHRASPRADVPTALRETLRSLQGKLVVLNTGGAVCFPTTVASAMRGLVRALAGDDADPSSPESTLPALGNDARLHADARRATQVLAALPAATDVLRSAVPTWYALALYEPAPEITSTPVTMGGAAWAAQIEFVAELPYRLALLVGTGAAESADTLADSPAMTDAVADAPAWRWGAQRGMTPWLLAEVLLPDDVALSRMTASTADIYRRVTGRAGAGFDDRYWHLPAWERFAERGRVVGHVAPAFLARGGVRAGGVTHALTPHHDRGFLVPPGYCLVRCVGGIELTVVTMPR